MRHAGPHYQHIISANAYWVQLRDNWQFANLGARRAQWLNSLITVEVNDKDPKRAADMVNTFIEELAKLMQNFALTDGSRIMSPRIN